MTESTEQAAAPERWCRAQVAWDEYNLVPDGKVWARCNLTGDHPGAHQTDLHGMTFGVMARVHWVDAFATAREGVQ